VPTTSLAVLYAVVVAPNVAALVYKAILNDCEVPELKSKSPPRISTLNDVAIACEIAICVSSLN
jgi:hypothetical protein